MPRLYMLFFALAFGVTVNVAANDPTQPSDTIVRLISDEWCPFTCLESSENRGLIVDVAEAAFKEVGHEVVYEVSPWARAIREVQNGRVDALLGADSAKRKELFLAEDFLIVEETVFAILDDSLAVIDTPSDLLNYKIGHKDNYNYGGDPDWQSAIEKHTNATALSGTYDETRLIDLLTNKRIEVAIMCIDIAKLYLRNHPEITNIKFIKKNLKSDLHIGFSPNPRGELLRSKFLEGYNRLKNSGQLILIYEKYGINMPS